MVSVSANHLREETQDMIALRVGIREDVEEDCQKGLGPAIISACSKCVQGADASQLSQSKKRVFMSMKSLPNNERFWQYSYHRVVR